MAYAGVVQFVEFECASDTKITPSKTMALPWPAFVARASAAVLRQEKDGKGFCPNVFGPTPKYLSPERVDACAVETTMATFDYDHINEEQAERIVDACRVSGYEFFLYTTHSNNPPNDCRFRLVFPINRPVLKRQHKLFRLALLAHIGIPLADKVTNNPSRFFYYHAASPANQHEAYTELVEGNVVDVDLVLNSHSKSTRESQEPATPAAKALPDTSIPRDAIIAELNKVREQPLATRIRLMLEGQPLASEGQRDSTIQSFCSQLVFRFPMFSDAALLDIMRPSLLAMGDDGEWVDKAEDKLERARNRKEEQDEQEREIFDTLLRDDRMLSSFSSTSGTFVSDEPYSDEEIAKFAEEQGCEPHEFRRRWMIQIAKAYFIFSNGKYEGPFPAEAADNTMRYDLSRARPDHVRFEVATKNDLKPAKLGDIVKAYGSVGSSINYSYVIQKSRYSPGDRTLTIATAPLRNIKPSYVHEIQKWLELLGGNETDRLLDWLATCTKLEQATCALYIEGPKGAGKSLLTQGLGRLYSTQGPTKLTGDHFVSWNDDFLKNPILVIDEELPTQRGQKTSNLLRDLITLEVRPIRKKYLDGVTLHGAVRLVCASNNDNLIRFEEDLNRADLDAIAERYFHLKVGKEPADYLEAIGGRPVTRTWVLKDLIASHVLWLRDNRTPANYGRLLVSGKMDEMRKKLTTTSGIAPEVCQFIVKSLLDLPNARDQVVAIKDGKVWVSCSSVAEATRWSLLVPGCAVPTESRVAEVLKTLCSERKKFRWNNEKNPRMRYCVDLDLLIHRAEETGLADREDIMSVVHSVKESTIDVVLTTEEAENVGLLRS